MTAPFEVSIRVGDLDWSVTELSPRTVGPTAPLIIGHSLPEDALWPAQPDPMTASFGLIAATVADVAAVVKGAECHIVYTAPPNPDPIEFAGNVTDVKVRPHRYTDPVSGGVVDGVLVGVVAVGYLAQLWEEAIHLTEQTNPRPLPGGGTQTWSWSADRLVNLFSATPWPAPDHLSPFPDETAIEPQLKHKLIDLDGDALGPHLIQLLTVWVGRDPWDPPDSPPVRYVIAPNLTATGSLDAAEPWRLDRVSNLVPIRPAADFAETPTGWGVVVDPSGATLADPIIDAGLIDRAVEFVQRKSANVTRVMLRYVDSGKDRTVSADTGATPTVKKTIESDVLDPNLATREAIPAFYLPTGSDEGWGVETVTWILARDAPGRLPPPLGSLVTFGPIPEQQNPNGRTWVSAMVASWQLTVNGRDSRTVELELRHPEGRLDASAPTGRLTVAELPPAVTVAQLRPDHTVADYALLGE